MDLFDPPETFITCVYLLTRYFRYMQAIVYLDERHLEWMSDSILQMVLADLRPLLLPKLQAEQHALTGSGSSVNAKKGTVGVHQGDTYQFAYFFRKTEPHSVLVKTRRFVVAPSVKSVDQTPAGTTATSKPGKRRRSSSKAAQQENTTRSKQQKTMHIFEDANGNNNASSIESEPRQGVDELSPRQPRRSKRSHVLVAGGYQDAEVEEQLTQDHDDINRRSPEDFSPSGDSDSSLEMGGKGIPTVKLEDETDVAHVRLQTPVTGTILEDTTDLNIEEEEKLKLAVRLKYQGFSISGRCLCVIVQPSPPLRKAISSHEKPATPFEGASNSLDATGLSSMRASTPLFLPDLDPRRSVTPLPNPRPNGQGDRLQARLFSDVREGQFVQPGGEDAFDMLQLSQLLHNTGGERAVEAEGDDSDGAAFMGDADESRTFY